MGEDPVLWRRLRLVVGWSLSRVKLLGLRRLQKLRRVEMTGFPMSDSLTSLIVKQENVTELDISSCNLGMVTPDTLGTLVMGLEEVVLNFSLTQPQLVTIFTVIQNKKCRLKKLYIAHVDLSSLTLTLLANSVIKMSTLSCRNCNLQNDQVEALFLAVSQTNLERLDLFWNDLSTVTPRLLSTSLTRIVSLNIGNTNLTPAQVDAVFLAIAKSPQLRELDISLNDLSSVSPRLVSSSLAFLVTVNLCGTMLSPDQVEAVFISLASKDSKLEHLNLSNNDLSTIRPYIIAYSIPRLISAELWATKLTTRQVRMLLSRVMDRESQLSKLNLFYNPAVFQLPPQLLMQARRRIDIEL